MRTIEPRPTDGSFPARRRGALPLAFALFASALSLYAAPSTAGTVGPCHVTVYANDTDPNGLDLRSGPGAGKLVRVLPGWYSDAGPLSLYYPTRRCTSQSERRRPCMGARSA